MSFASTVNGSSSRNWSLEPNNTIEHQFAETVSRMDGKDFFSYLIWRLPQGTHLENVIQKVAAGKEPNNYKKTAGRAAAANNEIRKGDDAGEVHHWTIGRRRS